MLRRVVLPTQFLHVVICAMPALVSSSGSVSAVFTTGGAEVGAVGAASPSLGAVPVFSVPTLETLGRRAAPTIITIPVTAV
ncbi:hypothetical protein AUCHE_05_00010, partial [Austwickia chelonae NBRC 105200]